MDLVKELKKAISTGKVYFGLEQAKKSLRKGEAKIFIVAKNCPDQSFSGNSIENVRIIRFDGNASELGSICGKMFDISVVTIVDPGESALIKEQ
ncbi:MAG: 50S ribosomal protein L30e [Thermoplasmata archaeon]|jgi:large subunit ribosomal protein L30e|nr:50S ribosomal protein L30e [Thermoplasmatales archaeon]